MDVLTHSTPAILRDILPIPLRDRLLSVPHCQIHNFSLVFSEGGSFPALSFVHQACQYGGANQRFKFWHCVNPVLMSHCITYELPGVTHSRLNKMHKNVKYILHIPSQLVYGALWWVRPHVLRIFSLSLHLPMCCIANYHSLEILALQEDNNDSSKDWGWGAVRRERLIFF